MFEEIHPFNFPPKAERVVVCALNNFLFLIPARPSSVPFANSRLVDDAK